MQVPSALLGVVQEVSTFSESEIEETGLKTLGKLLEVSLKQGSSFYEA
jgi:hypothetical protein